MNFLLLLVLAVVTAYAQNALLQRPDVQKAMKYLEANHTRHVEKQIQIAEIPAPTFHEAERAKFLAGEFRRVWLKNVEIDAKGNVLGWRPGTSAKTLVLAAHSDISFDPGVVTKVRREGKRLYGPGICDDSRGLTAILAIAEALDSAHIQTQRTILFVANVGEEGLGDLGGVKYLFQESPHKAKFDSFISVDHANPAHIVNGGTGVKRYRITYKAPGGHSYGNFGRPNAIHAAGRMIAKLATLQVPSTPKTTYNVGKIVGGTAVNAIAEQCSVEVDLRSEDPGQLDKLELKLLQAMRVSAEEENEFRKESGVQLKVESKIVGYRPAGHTAASQPLVAASQWAASATGHKPWLGFSSTDSNLPISLGVPAVTLGGGGRADNAHSLSEWFEPENAWKGPQMVLLTMLAFDASLK